MYSEIITEHTINPRNKGVLEDADAVGSARYHRCGDRMTLYFKIEDGVIVEAQFTGFACGPALAAASVTTTLVRGQSIEWARNLGAFQLNQALGGVPASKRHAILMVLQCLHEALGDRK